MTMFVGVSAFSTGRLKNLLSRIAQHNPGVVGVKAQYVHWLDAKRPLEGRELAILERLFSYGSADLPREPVFVTNNGEPLTGGEGLASPLACELWVVPRIGTVSPWSTKATDIAKTCGLGHVVLRLERGIHYLLYGQVSAPSHLNSVLSDRMTESVLDSRERAKALFQSGTPRPLRVIDVQKEGRAVLDEENLRMGLALTPEEIEYLLEGAIRLGRNYTDVELMMFAQINSEHCRHKVFNAKFIVDQAPREKSLFQMIRNTTEKHPAGVLSAYEDNAAVIEGALGTRLFIDPQSGAYQKRLEPIHLLLKVETHNHPTAISPFPGAATGSGGEIRDEAATGRGAKPKAGLVGFAVSNLRLPGEPEPWEVDFGRPARMASALDIMREGPLGAAAFNNEFGRPCLAGFFRTFELEIDGPSGKELRGYHKPIMLAGGVGQVREPHVHKQAVSVGAPLVVLGGPAMLIGLGGGAASSMSSGASSEDLDFASVQRDNPEMQRRCQGVIDACVALGQETPIVSIHDVGAGGLSNALPELVADLGAQLELRNIPSDEAAMSPLEIWCNESQERYVLALRADKLEIFEAICRRERAPFAVVGHATGDGNLCVLDRHFESRPIEVPLSFLFGKPPKMVRNAQTLPQLSATDDTPRVSFSEAATRVLRLPTVADKTFLITIGDRTVGGLVCRDQMVGPWQVPVADAAITVASFDDYWGEAFAVGERPPLALISAEASARMAIAEVITNLASAPIAAIGDIKLSANWMAAVSKDGEDARLYQAVRTVGEELCPRLGLAIPVGKDSLSMSTIWETASGKREMTAPLSLIVTGLGKVSDVRRALTPELQQTSEETVLLLVDLGRGKARLGGSCLLFTLGKLGSQCPDLDSPEDLKAFFEAIQTLSQADLLLAYHDRSDGGLFVTLVEMAFAGGMGLAVDLGDLPGDALAQAFCEELGAVIQVRQSDLNRVREELEGRKLSVAVVAKPLPGEGIVIRHHGSILFESTRSELRAHWSDTTYRMQRLRDDPSCAEEEQAARLDSSQPGLSAQLTFDPDHDVAAPYIATGQRPKAFVLREQGVNGHQEMAAALFRAGFAPIDVHMTDILEGRQVLEDFKFLAAPGGFSYGDVLGAGQGWAKSILLNQRARDAFAAFFARSDTLALGVCNGCQMLSSLRELIPGGTAFPTFVRNRSERFEARLSRVRVEASPSVLLAGMAGSLLPVAVAHGEGRAVFASEQEREHAESAGLVSARYVDAFGNPTERYPHNPNGSPNGVTAVTSEDGRVTIMMPHPERVFRAVQYSYRPKEWNEDAPWMRLFRNARRYFG